MSTEDRANPDNVKLLRVVYHRLLNAQSNVMDAIMADGRGDDPYEVFAPLPSGQRGLEAIGLVLGGCPPHSDRVPFVDLHLARNSALDHQGCDGEVGFRQAWADHELLILRTAQVQPFLV